MAFMPNVLLSFRFFLAEYPLKKIENGSRREAKKLNELCFSDVDYELFS